MTSALPKYDDFMQPTLQAVRDLGGSASIEEIQDKLTEMMGLTQLQLDAAYPKSGALIAPDRMSWARSHLKIAGLLASGGKACGFSLMLAVRRRTSALRKSRQR